MQHVNIHLLVLHGNSQCVDVIRLTCILAGIFILIRFEFFIFLLYDDDDDVVVMGSW